MCTMNVLEAKTKFSKILEMLENHDENEFVICRRNKPVAKIVLIPQDNPPIRIGIAKGKFTIPDDIHYLDDEIAAEFLGED
ncbi:MAG: hypothetical protein IKQ61_08210 [Spirochaetales bacterium]|nr:hypothetical protein [Spirochaetales bacterium]